VLVVAVVTQEIIVRVAFWGYMVICIPARAANINLMGGIRIASPVQLEHIKVPLDKLTAIHVQQVVSAEVYCYAFRFHCLHLNSL
jgi:hypothetical protein